MSDTTTRGDGVIVDRSTAGTGTLPRPVPRQGRTRPEREEGRTPRPRAPRPARADEARTGQARTAPVPSQARRSRTTPAQARQAQAEPRRTQADPKRPQPAVPGAPKARPKRPQAEPRPKRIRTAAPRTTAAPKTAQAAAATNRMPFIVLLCGLLGGALASALVISTTLAEGSFEISKLQQSDASLSRQRQQLQDQVSQSQSAPVLQQRASELGMRPTGQLQFLNLKTGKVENSGGSAGTGSTGAASSANETGPGAAVQNP